MGIPSAAQLLLNIDPLLAAQHEVGDQDIDRRGRQPHLRFDDVLARDDIVAELGQNAGDELANCSIRLGQENARHWLLDLTNPC